MSILFTIQRINEQLEKETDPHKREQYRQVIKQTIRRLEE